jgi:hypothetical protein
MCEFIKSIHLTAADLASRRKHPEKWAHGGAMPPVGRLHDWRSVYWAIGWTSIGIFVSDP